MHFGSGHFDTSSPSSQSYVLSIDVVLVVRQCEVKYLILSLAYEFRMRSAGCGTALNLEKGKRGMICNLGDKRSLMYPIGFLGSICVAVAMSLPDLRCSRKRDWIMTIIMRRMRCSAPEDPGNRKSGLQQTVGKWPSIMQFNRFTKSQTHPLRKDQSYRNYTFRRATLRPTIFASSHLQFSTRVHARYHQSINSSLQPAKPVSTAANTPSQAIHTTHRSSQCLHTSSSNATQTSNPP